MAQKIRCDICGYESPHHQSYVVYDLEGPTNHCYICMVDHLTNAARALRDEIRELKRGMAHEN